MGDRRNRIARLPKADRPTARKTRSATAQGSPGLANSKHPTTPAAKTQSQPRTRSAKLSGSNNQVQGSTPDPAIDGLPLISVPDHVEEAAVESQRTTGAPTPSDNRKETPAQSGKQALSSETEAIAGGVLSTATRQLAASLNFILDQAEKEDLEDQEELDLGADTEEEQAYEDESEEESEPGEWLSVQRPERCPN